MTDITLRRDLAWQDDGACRSTRNPDRLFYSDTEVVAGFCSVCAVAGICLEYALSIDERYGIWGGATPKQRRRLSSYLVNYPVSAVADHFVATGRTDRPVIR